MRRPLGLARPALLGFAALGVAVWALAGQVTSARGAQAGATELAANLPQPLDWVDQLTGGGDVTYLGQMIGKRHRPRADRVLEPLDRQHLDARRNSAGAGPTLTPDLARPDGTLHSDPGSDYVLTDNGVSMIGKTIENARLAVRSSRSPSMAVARELLRREPDGWIGSDDGTYAYFGPAKRGCSW